MIRDFSEKLKPSQRATRVMAEFLATFVFISIGIGSVAVVAQTEQTGALAVFVIALGHGLGIIIGAATFGSICGAHMNPAVTIAACVAKQISVREAIMYIAVQLLGATLAYALIVIFTGLESSLGVHGTLGAGVNAFEALLIEIMITFILVLVVFFTAISKKWATPFASFVIGLVVFGTNLFAIPFTGASLNPARSYAPSLINWEWTNHWIYWLGPIIGALLAVLVYKIVTSNQKQDGMAK